MMQKELKARIPNRAALEKRLMDLGAQFDQEIDGVETYFTQPDLQVLKVVDDSTGTYLLRLQGQAGGFVIEENRALADPLTVSQLLTKQYGIHRILQKRRRVYQLPPLTLDLNLIAEVGEFLVLVGESPTEADMETILGVPNPEYVRVPFSEL